jgi:hypothetical protein
MQEVTKDLKQPQRPNPQPQTTINYCCYVLCRAVAPLMMPKLPSLLALFKKKLLHTCIICTNSNFY